MNRPAYRIEAPHYPIVYVRGYAMDHGEREDTFHDTYYGFAATSVEKRQVPAPDYYKAEVFEGQFIRFMKLDNYYADAANRGIDTFHGNPSRSIWVCRFYDRDYFEEKSRPIEEHASELYDMVFDEIPRDLEGAGVDLGPDRRDYRVILIAHSMGGLVCRTLLQSILPSRNIDPKDWIHRLVTIGTPNRGIDLGRIPDFLENMVTSALNPFDSSMFTEPRMRDYLKLEEKANGEYRYDIHSVADHFPIKRCLNIIGSDYGSYTKVRHVTGAFSDGLVKQDRAYMVGGERPASDGTGREASYPDAQRAFWCNVHRAHSGRRGIVNSYESFENIHRFLFGNIIAQVWLDNLEVKVPQEDGVESYFDIEFTLTVRNTGVYLHRREQDPCENAIRVTEVPRKMQLHTAFMNSALKPRDSLDVPYSHFSIGLRIVEYRRKDNRFWDREYPAREIFSQALELRVGDEDPSDPGEELGYRGFGGTGEWQEAGREGVEQNQGEGERKVFRIPLMASDAVTGDLVIRAGAWPDPALVGE